MPEKDGIRKQRAEGASVERISRTPQRQVSIKDIARLARVTHPTVSRALQNSPLVNKQTAARIKRIADELGYRPSAIARSLVTRQTRLIGLVAGPSSNACAAALNIEEAARARSYATLLTHLTPGKAGSVTQILSERRVDGVVVLAGHLEPNDEALLGALGAPMILMNGFPAGTHTASVMTDHVQGGRTVTKHLLSLGHRRIGYVGDRLAGQANADRIDGYKKALVRAGIAFNDALIAHGDGTQESAFDAVNGLLALPVAPTAVCCYNDTMALGALRAIRMRGLRVPDDISIAGFDDLNFSGYLDPPLTTMRQSTTQLGALAVEALMQLIAGQRPSGPMRIEAELVVRASTGRSKDHPRRPLSD